MSTEYDVTKAFKRIENELIDSMIRNFKRHRVEENALGMQWEQWQVLQLKALEEYRRNNFMTFAEDFNDINERIEEALRTTYDNALATEEATILRDIKDHVTHIDLDNPPDPIQGEFFGVNKSRLDHMLEATEVDFNRGEFAMLRQANDEYRRIIFDAQVYASTGATYEQAVDMATKDFLQAGIQSITYKNGARHKMSDYASMAIRTGQKRAYLMGTGDARDKHGIHTVRVNKRTQACPQCVKWLNRVLVDDVYSGGTAEEAQKEQVPLLSQAIAEGFLHPNCKDIYSTYIRLGQDDLESSRPEEWTQEELQDLADKYNLEQELKRAEDMIASYRRLARNQLDEDDEDRYWARVKEWERRRDEIERKIDEQGGYKINGDWQIEPEEEDEIRKLIKEPLVSTGDDPWESAPELPRSWFGKDFYVDHEVTIQEPVEIIAGDHPDLMAQLKARGIRIAKDQKVYVGEKGKRYILGYNQESAPKTSNCGDEFREACQDRDKIFVGECYSGSYAWRGYSSARADRMDITFTRSTGTVVNEQIDCVFAKDKGRTKTIKMFFGTDKDYYDNPVTKTTRSGRFAYPSLDAGFEWSEELKQRVDYVSKQLWDEGIPYRMFRHRGTGGRGLTDKEAFAEYQKANGAFMRICKCDYIPTEITKEEYVGLKCKPLYRGVSNNGLRGDFQDVSCRDMIENFLQGELFASRGIYGDGASYHAINYYTSLNSYARRESQNVFELKLKDGAKTIKYDDALKLCERIHKANPDGDKLFFSNNQRGGYEVGKAMTILGYDCIIEPNGDGGGLPFYIPLSRGVLRYYRKPRSEGGDPYLLTPYTGRRHYW